MRIFAKTLMCAAILAGVLSNASMAAVAFTGTVVTDTPTAGQVIKIPGGGYNATVSYQSTFTFGITGATANQVFLVSADQTILSGVQPYTPGSPVAQWTTPGQGQGITCDGAGTYSSGNIILYGSEVKVAGQYNTKSTFEAHDMNNVSTKVDITTTVRNFSVSF
jgi:hypothetical protein